MVVVPAGAALVVVVGPAQLVVMWAAAGGGGKRGFWGWDEGERSLTLTREVQINTTAHVVIMWPYLG